MGTTFRNKNTGDVIELEKGDPRYGRLKERLDNWAVTQDEPNSDPGGAGEILGGATAPPAAGEPPEAVDYASKGVAELQKIADARNLTESITGSGKDGKVVKADLVAALDAYDQGLGQRG